MIAASDPERWSIVRRVATAHGLWFAIGVHPWWPDEAALDRLPDALDGANAIGETGLDYRTAKLPAERAVQRRLFDAHLALAEATGLPVVVHSVDALPDVLAALESANVAAQLHGVVRGDLPRAIRAGLYLSFGTDLERSPRARRWVARAPRDRVLLETDAPFRAVSSPRGEPADIARLAKLVAEAWSVEPAEVLAITGANARRLFAREAA